MLGSIYYILSFIKEEQKIYKLLISSFFLVLSLLAKIQIIILLFFILAIIPFLIKNEIDKNFNKEIILKYFNFYLIFYINIYFIFIFTIFHLPT